MNFNVEKTFEGGLSKDLTDNIEKKNTVQSGKNGRLYSNNGVLSMSSVEGSKLVYNNNNIVKYLGFHSFDDELIVFAKCLKTEAEETIEKEVCEYDIVTDSFQITTPADYQNNIDVTSEISDNSTETENCYTVENPEENVTDFNIDFNCDGLESNDTEIDFGEYYDKNVSVPNFLACSINNNIIPINNLEYYDCIYSLREGENGSLIGTRLWVGTQNWPLNGKITTEGVEENEFFKRVYYTDAVNYRRVVNIKDTSLLYRKASEFNQIVNNVLLQPEIEEIIDGGQLRAMKSIYFYRVISENGQVSEFSPASYFADIIYETDPIAYRGGGISELTNKRVKIKCNIIDSQPTSLIECIAVEYEAFGAPTAIRNLGKKSSKSVLYFDHYGNEAEFADDITINDILEYKNTWKYCNDFSSKKNKLIAVGLRNDPVPTAINNLEYLFPLHSWDENGDTHNCLMNPKPWVYRYVDPSNEDSLIYIKQKVYRTISSFGDLTITLTNKETSDSISFLIENLPLEEYSSITSDVIDWLIDEKTNNADFDTFFPNLEIQDINGQLLFTPVDDNIQTNMSNYAFTSNNDQFIENFENDIVFLETNVNTSNLVYGAQSIGFNEGTGIRVSYKEFKEPLLNQATDIYDGTGTLLDYHKPSGTKFFMKGEIYRLSFQAYDNDSTRFFSIPVGDVMIPSLGDLKSEIDNSGNAVITSKAYVNQSIEDGVLYGHGVKMKFEVRLSCELQEAISMYQVLHVERDEENRTILCQGISAPLMRYQHNGSSQHNLHSDVRNKWMLPYYGGPTYEHNGLIDYDNEGENFQELSDDNDKRTMQHRGLMYFDSPDLYFGRISDQYVKSSKINIVGKLNTDHTSDVIRERGGTFAGRDSTPSKNFGNEIYPKFSRKILEDQVEGDNHSSTLPIGANEDRGSSTYLSHFINVSVFANYQNHNKDHDIKFSRELKRAEIVSGAAFDLENDISNNAFCFPNQPWFYGSHQRKFSDGSSSGADAVSTIIEGAVRSPGYKTTIIKTTEDLFTTEFIGPVVHLVDPQIRLGGDRKKVYDTIPLINIFRNNRDFVYGGRTKEAFASNVYIPLSRTIPTLKSSNATQEFYSEGDTYVTLNIRTKNDYGDDELFYREFNNGSGRARGDISTWRRNGAWAYVVVLETQVEPKLTYQYEFYKETSTHSFQITRDEIINKAYFNTSNLKKYIPKPFRFKDDPDLGNVIAVSDVKLAGELFDAWTVFKPNNFYAELEKNKGDIFNVIKEKDNIYAVQRNQTSLIIIGTDRILSDSDGKPINIKQGSGTVVDGHQVVSSYGTSIRRAVKENYDYGFCFFDENKLEFVKINKPLFFSKSLHLDILDRYSDNPIVDSECYFDDEHKETNIRVRAKDGSSTLFSYNEALGVFNLEREFNNDIYMDFKNKVFSPITVESENEEEEPLLSEDLHVLGKGESLNFFNEQKTMVIGFYINSNVDKVFQYKQWNAICNIDYPFKSIFFKSNLGHDRTILGTHNWYKIREGNHSVPAVNESNVPSEYADVRGNWVYVEMEVESLNKNKVNILAVINSLRISHQ